MSDYNPTEPNQRPTDPGDAHSDDLNPTLSEQEPEIYEGDTRPSLGTIQSMQQQAREQADATNTAQRDSRDGILSEELDALRARSQSAGDAESAPDLASPAIFSASAASASDDPPSDASGDAQMARASSVQARYSDRLLQLPHVVGVGIGYMQVGDVVTDQVAIIVMVDRKVDASELQPNEMIPKQIEDVPIMIQEVGTLKAF